MHRHQIKNYESLPFYACEVSVDDEPSFNETIKQKTRKCENESEMKMKALGFESRNVLYIFILTFK